MEVHITEVLRGSNSFHISCIYFSYLCKRDFNYEFVLKKQIFFPERYRCTERLSIPDVKLHVIVSFEKASFI